ncbi:hypothetical protein SRHO_G00142820 [Serrasalmus rhombeus]
MNFCQLAALTNGATPTVRELLQIHPGLLEGLKSIFSTPKFSHFSPPPTMRLHVTLALLGVLFPKELRIKMFL